jgi:hypothetical protein
MIGSVRDLPPQHSTSRATGNAKEVKMLRKSGLVGAFICLTILIVVSGTALASNGGRNTAATGVPLYVIIEVEWDAAWGWNDASWTVWGPIWEPVIGGELITSCDNCLAITGDYTFRANGKIVQFDEVMVPTVTATPQSRHVVLYDFDGDGTYTGSLSSWHYFPWWDADNSSAASYFDRIDYEITFDADGNMTHFYYCQYEHKKLKE